MWIIWNLFRKFREITSSKLILNFHKDKSMYLVLWSFRITYLLCKCHQFSASTISNHWTYLVWELKIVRFLSTFVQRCDREKERCVFEDHDATHIVSKRLRELIFILFEFDAVCSGFKASKKVKICSRYINFFRSSKECIQLMQTLKNQLFYPFLVPKLDKNHNLNRCPKFLYLPERVTLMLKPIVQTFFNQPLVCWNESK